MATLVERWLGLADELIAAHPRSSGAKRRAVSTAYYAAFHALLKVCADALGPDLERDSDEYARLYRALDHGPLKNAFQISGPLRTVESLRRLGSLIVPLQSARMQADYAPPRVGFYQTAEASDFVAQAREIVALIAGLSREERAILAVHLIFKDRR
jgi:hypothetical protein